jgi:hypothetical protein
VATTTATQKIMLHSATEISDFEMLFAEEILPNAAEAPGSVNRGGRSAIGSQHLMRLDGEGGLYLWVVKSSGVFSTDGFTTVISHIEESSAEKLDAVCDRERFQVWSQVRSYDAGPRSQMGVRLGDPLLDIEF